MVDFSRHERYTGLFEGLLKFLTVLITVVLALNLIVRTFENFRVVLASGALLITVASWVFLRQKKVRLAANTLVMGYWLLTSLLLLESGGLSSPWLLSQFSIVLMGGLLVGKRTSNILTALSLVFDVGLYIAQANGATFIVATEWMLQEQIIAVLANFFTVALVVYFGRDLIARSLDDSRSNARLYRSLFEKTNDAVFIIDPSQRYIDANQQAVNLLGYSLEELRGMTVPQVVVPEERGKAQEKVKVLKEREMLPVYERKVVCKDGSRKTVEVNLALVLDDKGDPLHYQSIVRDVSERKLLERQIQHSLDDMEEMAMQDPLTGLLNRRAITEHAEAEWHRAKREGQPLCLMLVDMDNLKSINDQGGHMAGDQALVKLANAIGKSKRRYDWTGRWGGDEFLVVLPNTSLSQAKEVAERVRALVKSAEGHAVNGHEIPIEVSLGVACFSARPTDDTSLDKLLSHADQALYEAKESGRDQVKVYRD